MIAKLLLTEKCEKDCKKKNVKERGMEIETEFRQQLNNNMPLWIKSVRLTTLKTWAPSSQNYWSKSNQRTATL